METVEIDKTVNIKKPLSERFGITYKTRPDELLGAGRSVGFRDTVNERRMPFQEAVEDDLLIGLDFLLVFYLVRAQIGAIRSERERQRIFRGMDFVNCSKRIDRELRELDFLEVANARQRRAPLIPQPLGRDGLRNQNSRT